MKLHETERFYGTEDSSTQYEAIEQAYNFKIKDLIRSVENYRRTVEMAWSKNTAYPGLRYDPDVRRFSPLAQCAPTVRLLKDELLTAFPQLAIHSMQGAIENGDERVLTQDHVWLEIPVDDDAIIIDVTPDQREAVGETAPKVIMGLRNKLDAAGYKYQAEIEDTDERMRRTGSYQRYEFLKRRYDKIQEDHAYYKELFDGNIFIVGGTATGKSELAGALEEQYPFEALDVGQLFRVATYLLKNDNEPSAIQPDIEKIAAADQVEIDRVIGAISRKRRFLNKGILDDTRFVKRRRGEQRVMVDGKDITDELDTRDMNVLVSTIAQSEQVRSVIWKWINRFSEEHGQVILTGHTLRDIDSTKFKIIHLTVHDDFAAQRLYNRSANTFVHPSEALVVVQQRDKNDHMKETDALLGSVHMVDELKTDTLSEPSVRFRALRRLVAVASADADRRRQQAEIGLERDQFEWQVNPLLSYIREAGKDIFFRQAELHRSAGITEFEVAIQTMMHLSGREVADIWQSPDPLCLADILNLIELGNTREGYQQFIQAIADGQLILNVQLVQHEAERQTERILRLYGREKDLPAAYMGNPERSPFRNGRDPRLSKQDGKVLTDAETGQRMLRLNEVSTSTPVVVKRVPAEISDMYGRGFHYLHSGRKDEAAAFGVYVEGEDLPFAWVSYSPVDRGYKKDILRHMQVEPHRMLEMTRAWNASWSPKNTMSILFSFAHDQLRHDWKQAVDDRQRDKPLAGIITAINGNLGFKANAFNGVGFETIGLKPANFSFLVEADGELTYMSRREIMRTLGLTSVSELDDHPRYRTNQVPLLPTNEMVVVFDTHDQERLQQQRIYRIPETAYSQG